MEYLNNLKDQEVLPMNQLGDNAAKTVQLSASRGEHHILGSKPSHQPTKMVVTAPTFDQQLQFEDEVENNISDPEAEDGLFNEPIHCAGRLSFLVEAFQQLNPIWLLRLLSATCLIIIAAVVSILFYPHDLHEAKIIHDPLDPPVLDPYHTSLQLPAGLQFVGFSGQNPLLNSSAFKVFNNDSQVEGFSIWMDCSLNLSDLILAMGPEMVLSESSTGMLEYIVYFILGPNQSEPIWRLRLLAALSLVFHTTLGILILPRYLHGIQATYQVSPFYTSFLFYIIINYYYWAVRFNAITYI